MRFFNYNTSNIPGYENNTYKLDTTGTPVAIRSRVNNALIVIDGKVQKESGSSSFEALNPDTIESINVLKGERAIGKYGSDGTDGVIEITTKK